MAPSHRMIFAAMIVLASLASSQVRAEPPETPQQWAAPAPAQNPDSDEPDGPKKPPPTIEATPEYIGKAIRVGVEAIFDAQEKDGRWESPKDEITVGSTSMTFLWGNTAMALLTLETVETDLKNEHYQKGLKTFFDARIQTTYEVSLRAMLLSRIIRRTTDKSADTYRDFLKQDALRLIKTQMADGGWTYNYAQLRTTRPADFSNTQMAIAALSEAVAAGVDVPPPVFEKAQNLFIKSQLEDGGWNYENVPPRSRPPGWH